MFDWLYVEIELKDRVLTTSYITRIDRPLVAKVNELALFRRSVCREAAVGIGAKRERAGPSVYIGTPSNTSDDHLERQTWPNRTGR